MNVSMNWISDYVDLSGLDREELIHRFTLSTAEVEEVYRLGTEINGVVVAEIKTIEDHPNSKKLHLLELDRGDHTDRCVCGAPNVRVGMRVPFAPFGASVVGMTIGEATIAGVVSRGMCCSAAELGIADSSSGLLELPADAPLGRPIKELWHFDDIVFEVDNKSLTNRPDLWGHYGIAREFAAIAKRPLKPMALADLSAYDALDPVPLGDIDPELCYRYSAIRADHITEKVSPIDMQIRLYYCGMRAISLLADLTNYIMLELGQPTHAFDSRRVGTIGVQRFPETFAFKTLDGTERRIDPETLMITSDGQPVAVAGVMGGENSEIVGDTAMVLFESANFDGASIRRTATALGMRTDASSRYEKGLDPENTLKAVQRACELVELLGAGEVVEGIIDAYPSPVPETVLHLDPEKINRLLGTDLTVPAMLKILQDLGFSADTATPDNPIIHVPSWRADVVHYSDLAEEVARFYGYNNIPTRFTSGAASAGGFSPEQQCENRVGEVCRSLGMDEIITYSFISPSAYDRIRLPADSPLRNSLKILNPLGEDTSVMRTTILPSMLEILTRNYNYRNPSANFYEIGRTYHPQPDGLADEPKTLSLGAYGPNMNFYKVKGWAETILSSLGISGARFVADAGNPSYHPGRCADILVSGETIGVLGQIHPRVMRNYSSDFEAFCAQLSFDALFRLRGATPVFKPLPRFPAVSRDIAVVCPAEVPAGDMVEVIKKAGGMKLVECRVFDVYQGHHIEAGKKSVAFSLSMRSDDGTLTDADADEIVKNVLKALKESFSAEIR